MKAATIICIRLSGSFSISIHAAREGGDSCCKPNFAFYHISIHAAREGGDVFKVFSDEVGSISIHAAREGGDGGNV